MLQDDDRLILVAANKSADRITGIDNQSLIGKDTWTLSRNYRLETFLKYIELSPRVQIATQTINEYDDGESIQGVLISMP